MHPFTPYPKHQQPFPYHRPPYPNPNHNFLPHPPPPPPPSQPSPQISRPPSTSTYTTKATATSSSIPDLSTTLSSLTNLLSLSDQILSSPKTTLLKPQTPNFIPCPYNPHHLMPPHSLFLHSLQCPSPLLENPSSLIESLHYTKTLNPENPGKDPISVAQPVQDPQRSELCFSLEHYYNEFTSHFFYKDCPAAVNFRDLDSSKKTFTLPAFLSVECGCFAGNEGENKDIDESGFRVLASGLLAIRREIEGWTDYPRLCSYNVVSTVLRFNLVKLSDLRSWIIANSPRYGVVIDVYMTNHVSLLFKLCLKAVRKGAMRLMGSEEIAKSSSFEFPVLRQVLGWIAFQLSVLYGEMNAKYFAIHIFKQCVLEASKGLLFHPLELKESLKDSEANESDVRNVFDQKKVEEPADGSEDCRIGKGVDEGTNGDVIIMSQVAAAVAALHERSLLEAKIKALRVSQMPPIHLRMAECALVSQRADDERKKRPNYRAIIEHDGILRKNSSNEDTNKTKSREELLAEERDYKRRRMSYRGKKLKRTPLQVLRDIIDEYTEEIKQAGGIGIFDKGPEDEGTSLKLSSIPDHSIDIRKQKKGNSDPSEATRSTENHYYKQSQHDHNIRSTASRDELRQEDERQGQGHCGHHERLQYHRSTSRDRYDRDNHPGRSVKHRNHEQRHEHERTTHRKEQNEVFSSFKDRGKRSSSKSKYHDYKPSSYVADSASNIVMHKDDRKLHARDRHPGYPYGSHKSNSLSQDPFEDRYVPPECDDMDEDNVYSDIKHVRQEEFSD